MERYSYLLQKRRAGRRRPFSKHRRGGWGPRGGAHPIHRLEGCGSAALQRAAARGGCPASAGIRAFGGA
jgi:hypothetical protein